MIETNLTGRASRGAIRPFAATAALIALAAILALQGCTTLISKRIRFEGQPVLAKIKSVIIDEDTLKHTVIFRNIGREIVSFDYTVCDGNERVHVDADGPDSGLIENLYPGAEVEIDNPKKKSGVNVVLGTVVHGKQTKEQIAALFRPGTPRESSGAALDAGLPTL
jgi:hypothetical protein